MCKGNSLAGETNESEGERRLEINVNMRNLQQRANENEVRTKQGATKRWERR